MRTSFSSILTFLVLVPAALAQFGGGDTGPKASITGSLTKRDGAAVQGVVTVAIEDGWHSRTWAAASDAPWRDDDRDEAAVG